MPRFEVVIAKKAEEDLAEIYQYIARTDGAEQAERIQERVISAILGLETMPVRGKIPPEMRKLNIDDYREIQSSPWRIFYYVLGNTVGVVAVLDGRRNVKELLEKRLLQ